MAQRTPRRTQDRQTTSERQVLEHRAELRHAVTLAIEAAEIGRKVGLLGARMAAETGVPGVFNDATTHGLRCRDWRVDLEEFLRIEERAPEVLELCAAALQDIANAYAAAARAIKVTEAIKQVEIKV
jgi:hypothetical protein